MASIPPLALEAGKNNPVQPASINTPITALDFGNSQTKQQRKVKNEIERKEKKVPKDISSRPVVELGVKAAGAAER